MVLKGVASRCAGVVAVASTQVSKSEGLATLARRREAFRFSYRPLPPVRKGESSPLMQKAPPWAGALGCRGAVVTTAAPDGGSSGPLGGSILPPSRKGGRLGGLGAGRARFRPGQAGREDGIQGLPTPYGLRGWQGDRVKPTKVRPGRPAVTSRRPEPPGSSPSGPWCASRRRPTSRVVVVAPVLSLGPGCPRPPRPPPGRSAWPALPRTSGGISRSCRGPGGLSGVAARPAPAAAFWLMPRIAAASLPDSHSAVAFGASISAVAAMCLPSVRPGPGLDARRPTLLAGQPAGSSWALAGRVSSCRNARYSGRSTRLLRMKTTM